jgi:uncharacterized protein
LSLSEGGRGDGIVRGCTRLERGALAAFAFLICGIAGAYAQGTGLLSSSYITPFPQTDRYQLRVIGDWLGNGLGAALQETFKNDSSVQIAEMSRPAYGLARVEQTGLSGEIDRMIAGTPPVHIAIIMLGINDQASIRTANGWARPGSDEWKDLYGKEAEKFIKKLRSANIAVYWVGLPVMGSPQRNEFVAVMNDTVRQAAYLSGAKFIETAAGFTGPAGAYSAFGPDLQGQTKRLREGDGVGLTPAGNLKLASYIETVVRRDLAQARSQRNIPLAGDEEEQARVVPGAPRKAASAGEAKQAGPASSLKRSEPAPGKPDAGSKSGGGFKTELLAPPSAAPSPSAAQDAARREQAAFGGGSGPLGEFILADLGDGLTSIAVISPVSDLSIREIQRQTPLADRLYFKVLSKGEALPAKDGRADDFRWRGNAPPAQQSQ